MKNKAQHRSFLDATARGSRLEAPALPDAQRYRHRYEVAGLVLCTVLLAAGCRKAGDRNDTPAAPASEPQTRKETVDWGPIQLAFSFTPAAVSLDRDVMLDLTVSAPERMDVELPALDDRFGGFAVSGQYEDPRTAHEGTTTRRMHYRLTPQVATEYRLAPFAVTYTDKRTEPAVNGWFPTRPILLSVKPLVEGDPGRTLHGEPQPIRIHPPFRTVVGYVALALAAAGILFGVWKFFSRVREAVAVKRLSPRERALRELRQLLAKGLIERGLVKDFYVELTMVVRRYIERQHGVRAPEQTTEEFLAAVSHDGRFAPDVMARLRAFLQAADMVKFAAYQPGSDAVNQATGTAEDYINRDAAQQTGAEGVAR